MTCNCDGCVRRRKAVAQREARKLAQQDEARQQYRATLAQAEGPHANDCPCVVCHARAGALYCSEAE